MRPDNADLARRQIGDPDADEAISKLADGASTNRDGALQQMIRELRDLDRPPDWAQPWLTAPTTGERNRLDLVRSGQQFFERWDLDIVSALFCASLPFAYAAADGVEVLERTSQLVSPETVALRIAETGRMLVAITSLEGLASGPPGHLRVRQVRLLHAAIRAELMGGAWDSEALGCPINQDDLFGTLLSFTTVVFRALGRLGLPVTDADKQAYLQLWAAAGELLGIRDATAALDPAHAEQLTEEVAGRLHRDSAAGRHLMAVLMDEMELSMPWGMQKLPRTMVRHVAGEDIADLLGVARAAWWRPVLAWASSSSRIVARIPGGTRLLQAPSRLIGRSAIRMWIDRTITGQQQPPFVIDEVILARWKIRTSPHRNTLTLRGRARQARYRRRGR